ncbi:MAG: T9SS type A sorting domain-containing protein, partial [Bacteroidia bacterium]|nr:T9SS type A sorting domain-containing protein [Bacteroidia bacterium]
FIQHFSECNCEISDLDDDIEPLDLKIYPKPFSETLNISTGNSTKYFIVLYDLTSRKIVEKEFYNSISLNTSEFSEGVYIYQLIKENVLVAKGVVVK